MTISTRRARLGSLLAVALGALALIALPALASAKHGSDDGAGHSNGRENAGTVASYDSASGELTIDLRGGGTASALVTDETRIRCVGVKRGGHHQRQRRGRGRGHRCGSAALSEGATIRKARIESAEGDDAFTKILVEKPKRSCAKHDDDGAPEKGAAQDDDGTADQGPGDA